MRPAPDAGKVTDKAAVEASGELVGKVFGFCWQKSVRGEPKEAIIPPAGTLSVVLNTKEQDGLLITDATAPKPQAIIHDLTNRLWSYERPRLR